MNAHYSEESLKLDRGQLMRLKDANGAVVHVSQGEVWLTQERSTRDHVLGAGQWFRLDRDGTAILHSFHGCELTLRTPQKAAGGWLGPVIERLREQFNSQMA